ncbi:hypothetical protein BDN72DRAFT_890698 [Pluteus cervinus]|uniref:Uncharacterized protein n=1 Tax=Pluteus cervinus TaxID=181527 RepID=A0ACD3BGA3_9AGAR|nr:hypothetical protein BDN72DRAFT_890698 [Pluteus cervinus]
MSSTPPAHRPPRKSSSFLSLRREKDKTPSPQESSWPTEPSGPSSFTTKSSYFDVYPRSKSGSNPRPPKQRPRGLSRSSTITEDRLSSRQESCEPSRTTKSSPEPTSYAFPSVDSTEDIAEYPPYPLTPKPYPRTRSRTGPSGRSPWDSTSTFVPHLRFSGSSSTQHTETPPRTPIDVSASTDSLEHFPVVVAAPVAGVETMDAFVDHMNGGDDLGTSTRSRYGLPTHPLYMPPLPTPPPGIVLGGSKGRKIKHRPRSTPPQSSDSGTDDEGDRTSVAASKARKRKGHRSSSRAGSISSSIIPSSTSTLSQPVHEKPSPPVSFIEPTPKKPTITTTSIQEKRKTVVPSISEIIRTYAPPESQVRRPSPGSRAPSLYAHSQGHATLVEEPESEPEPLTKEEEAEFLSRSSLDSVADEVQRTLRIQNSMKPPPPSVPPTSFSKRQSFLSDNASICSPRSDPGAPSSIHSSSAASIHHPPSPLDTPSFLTMFKPSPSQAVAQYLRSARLTTMLKLTRSPHASVDNPLTVSLSDLGSQTGFPVVVFLGLGCVRHLMGLYDEMAECLGLRLITIDRWGLGRTESRSKSLRGIAQWASVVEEVLDILHIERCSIMAHSAGAPYALSFANKVPHRVVGDICLLAPWVGGGDGGYKWLKYVPNGLLKTAQAAEWRIQAWMIGKPPTISYQGIGYTAQPSTVSRSTPNRVVTSPPPPPAMNLGVVYPSRSADLRRPSVGSASFSEYDDLGDFEGRFESRSTLGAVQHPTGSAGIENKVPTPKRKPSRGFLNRLKGNSNNAEEKPIGPGKRLKALRSMGSLKGKSSSKKSDLPPPSSPKPPSLKIDVGLGFHDLNDLTWPKAVAGSDAMSHNGSLSTFSDDHGMYRRAAGRRSISFTTPKHAVSMPPSPAASSSRNSFTPGVGPGSAYQAALGNALIAASHSESAKGTNSDLMQILNHENHSWGFSYSAYPHTVRVWYGDKDEKIAENAVRWMERNMGEEKCQVKVVKGADHGLMYRSSVVVEVLENMLTFWKLGKDDYY